MLVLMSNDAETSLKLFHAVSVFCCRFISECATSWWSDDILPGWRCDCHQSVSLSLLRNARSQ